LIILVDFRTKVPTICVKIKTRKKSQKKDKFFLTNYQHIRTRLEIIATSLQKKRFFSLYSNKYFFTLQQLF